MLNKADPGAPTDAHRLGVASFVWSELASHDRIVLAYHGVLLVAVTIAPPNPDKLWVLGLTGSLFLFSLLGIALTRSGKIAGPFSGALLYRLAIYGTVQASYFSLRALLPVVNSGSLDDQLLRLDRWLFGVEPALWLDPLVTPGRTEWFAFFYFSYFLILGLHIFGHLIFDRDPERLGRLCFGLLFVFSIGHIIYMLVPGYGPIRALSQHFERPLSHGFWHDMVMGTVAAAGAQKDIFPSLHTAAPAFIAMFSFSLRERSPFRYTWPVLTFFVLNIVLATQYLRWHYAVDVLAGLLLAAVAHFVGVWLIPRELGRRRAKGQTPHWPIFGSEITSRTLEQRRSPRPPIL